jgi:hypothetical protein
MEPQNQQQSPQVFTPGQQPAAPEQPQSQPPVQQPVEPSRPESPAPLSYNSGQLEQQQAPDFSQGVAEPSHGDAVSWTASEFIAHEKNGSWYAMLAAGAIILSIIVFIVTKEWFSIIGIAVLAIAVGVFGNVKPRELNYAVAPDGVTIGDKHFGFETFTSFAVLEDGVMPSLQLLPQKRFMVPITMYLDPAQADEIIDALGDYLPYEQKKRDMTERISTRFRF